MIKKIYILLLLLFFISCDSLFENDTIYGCLDEIACNYSATANTNDSDLCIYALDLYGSNFYNCDGECDADLDGNIDEIGDDIDVCGVCGGTGVDIDGDEVCDDVDPCIGSSNNGYSCIDIHVIYDFIKLNPSLDTNNVEIINLVGNPNWWDNDRLTYLSLADLDLISVPESIGNLDSLDKLYLNNNKLSSLPASICSILPLNVVQFQENNLCDYDNFPECIYDKIEDFEQDCQD